MITGFLAVALVVQRGQECLVLSTGLIAVTTVKIYSNQLCYPVIYPVDSVVALVNLEKLCCQLRLKPLVQSVSIFHNCKNYFEFKGLKKY